MDTIDWRFSQDRGAGSRIVSLGLNGAGQGIQIETLYQDDVSSLEVTDAESFTYARDFAAIRPTLKSGVVLLHLIATPSATMSLPADLVLLYGGQALTADIAFVETAGEDVIEALAYLWIGDGHLLLSDLLEIAFSSLSGADTVQFAYTIEFIDGIAETGSAFLSAGTEDVFASPLTLDPGPSTDWQLVVTGACQGRVDPAETSVIQIATPGYVTPPALIEEPFALGAISMYACDTSYNCDCDVDPDNITLGEIRQTMLELTGYAAQAANPPPGIANMYDGFANRAQKYVYAKTRSMNTERFFTWQLVPGIRYYGLRNNINCCAVALNRYRIEGAWIQDLNNVWWPLIGGIDPTAYTLDRNFGWPTNFEVRQCIEVFPAPQAAYKLRIKGHFQLLPLTEDDDVTTIPSEPILNWAIFLAKSHKGMKDATIYSGMADAQLDDIVAGRHVTRRYIPGTAAIPVPTPPVMVRFDS